MTLHRVPLRFLSTVPGNSVRTSYIPSAIDWRNMGMNVLYLNGRGVQEIASFSITSSALIPAGSTAKFDLVSFPQPQTNMRKWDFVASTDTVGSSVFSVTVNGLTKTYGAGLGSNTFSFLEVVSPLASSARFHRITASFSSGSGRIESIQCYGVPRLVLDDLYTHDNPALNVETFRSRYPIYAEPGDNPDFSVRAITVGVSRSLGNARRAALLTWCAPDGSGSFAATSTTTPASLFAVSAACQLPRTYADQQIGYASVYISSRGTTSDTVGSVTVTTRAGETTIYCPTGAGQAWASGSVPMYVDGMSAQGFSPTLGTTDEVMVSYNLSTGSTWNLNTLHIGEEAGRFDPIYLDIDDV